MKRLLASDVTIFTGLSVQKPQSASHSTDKGSMENITNSPMITNGYCNKRDVEHLELREVVRGLVSLDLLLHSTTQRRRFDRYTDLVNRHRLPWPPRRLVFVFSFLVCVTSTNHDIFLTETRYTKANDC